MKFELTRTEYRNLIDMLYIASWVLSAHHAEPDERVAPFDAVEQKLLSFAPKLGLSQWVEFHEDLGKFYTTRKFEDKSPAHTFINEYDDASFWDELVNRLAVRDAAKEAGGWDAYAAMSGLDRIRISGKYEDMYNEETQHDGLKRLQFVPPLSEIETADDELA
jgi:hypothetical protein